MNSGGSRKTTSSAFANIGGSRKQIYPYSATTVYTYAWNKYNCVSKTGYTDSSSYQSNVALYTLNWITTPYVYTFSSYSISSNGTFTRNGSSSAGRLADYTYPPSGYFSIGSDDTTIYYNSGDAVLRTERLYDSALSEYYYGYYADNLTVITVIYSTTYKCGSTYYGQVTSTNRYAYPDNNYSGSYWYVYAGEV